MSIRRQLNKSLLVSLFLLFAVFCLALFLLFKQIMLKEFDHTLLLKAQTLASLVEFEIEGEHHNRKRVDFEIEFHEKNLPEFQKGENPEYYKLSSGGKILAESKSFEGHSIKEIGKFPMEETKPYDVVYDIYNVKLPNGKKGRAIGYIFFAKPEEDDEERGEHSGEHGGEHGEGHRSKHGRSQPEKKVPKKIAADIPQLSLLLARSREEMDQSVFSLLLAMIALGVVLPFAVIPIINRALTTGLSPLKQIASETETIKPDNLAHRFDCENLPEELKPIASRLNDLLDRVETALAREQRFNADVAHELRTPIAELRALSEVGLKNSGTEDPKTYFEDSLEIALRMEHLSTALLELKRIEAKRYKINPTKINLSQLIQECWKVFSETAKTKGLKLHFELDKSVEIESDKTLMEAILKNLFSNAVSHSIQDGDIYCKLETNSTGFILTLSNSHNSLCEDDLDHLFEPFWSKDASRTDAHHCGLGLSLLKVYAETLDLQIDVSLENPNKISFSIYS